MTPLASSIVRELTLPRKRRSLDDGAGLLGMMDDVHCFEVSNVLDAAHELMADFICRPKDVGILAFLPAPKTWIEFKRPGTGKRFAILLHEQKHQSRELDHDEPHFAWIEYCDERGFKSFAGGDIKLTDSFEPDKITDPSSLKIGHRDYPPNALIYALLALINSPRVVGRRQHMPNRGLERKLIASNALVGKFPLRAWTEIKLSISAPKLAGSEESIEAHLTGERALHFCRSHLRIRLGRLEIVRAHWRGDPALGIKQSRYTLTA